jgi:hypothetical protein
MNPEGLAFWIGVLLACMPIVVAVALLWWACRGAKWH